MTLKNAPHPLKYAKKGAWIINLLQLGDNIIGPGLEGILYSIITGTWTCFETLSADLWEAAINAHPDCLANLNGTKKASEIDDDDKRVPLQQIAKHKWNLTNSMGSILKDRYNFSKLEHIRHAYKDAFSKHGEKINSIINNQSLDELNILRNLIVHKAGKVDDKYIWQSSKFKGLPKANINDKVTIDGEIACRILVNAYFLGLSLVQEVSDWISTY